MRGSVQDRKDPAGRTGPLPGWWSLPRTARRQWIPWPAVGRTVTTAPGHRAASGEHGGKLVSQPTTEHRAAADHQCAQRTSGCLSATWLPRNRDVAVPAGPGHAPSLPFHKDDEMPVTVIRVSDHTR